LVETARDKDCVVLSTAIGEEVLVLKTGSAPRLTHLSFQADPATDLKDAQKYLAAQGIGCELRHDVTPGVAVAAGFTDPANTRVDFFVADRPAGPTRTADGVVPLKLGHIAFAVPKAKLLVDFYTTHLGFRVSDWMGDYFAFMRCGPDHHTLNYLDDETTRIITSPLSSRTGRMCKPRASSLASATARSSGDPAATVSAIIFSFTIATMTTISSSSISRWIR
jgi:hypothetical protein